MSGAPSVATVGVAARGIAAISVAAGGAAAISVAASGVAAVTIGVDPADRLRKPRRATFGDTHLGSNLFNIPDLCGPVAPWPVPEPDP